MAEMLGYASKSELLARNLEREVYFDPSQRRVNLFLVESRGTELKLETRWRKKDGSPIWVELTGHVVDHPGEPAKCYEGLAIEITERKAAEDALREGERKMYTLLGNLPGIAYRSRNDGWCTMEFISEGCRELTGYSPRDLMVGGTLSFRDLILPDDRDKVREQIHKSLPSGEPYQVYYRIRTADGAIRWVWERGEWIRADAGEVGAREGFISDITERKLAEERVREQAALLDRAQDAIYVVDLDGRIGFWSKGAGHVFGWDAEEASGRKADDLLRKDGPAHEEILSAVLGKGEWIGENTDRAKDGRSIIVECRCSVVRDERGVPVSILVIKTNVTEKKNIERQFLRAQRMESIGTLAAGIAHDLNNVLAPITMSIAMLRTKVVDSSGLKWVDTIDASAARAADIVRQVLGFGRGIEGNRVLFHPGHVMKEVLKITGETFPKSVAIHMSVPDDLVMIVADPTQIHQVLLNLCLNARDAMPCGGTMKIAAENVTLDGHYAKLNLDARPGPYLCLSVTDTGSGIPPEVLDRIFDPFFTTKPPGKGTGLGLSTAQAILKSHGGFINVYTEMGRGTTIRIYLPAKLDPGAARAEEMDSSAPAGNGELILVVDDEPSILEITKGMLEANGYAAITACNGAEALGLYRSSGTKIRATITDLMMPVMDGASTIRELRRLDPSAIIIASSGFGVEHSAGADPAPAATMFLRKPYTAEKLLQVLHKVLHIREEDPGLQ
jgi:PAS domain S-box-containing protein